MSIGEILQWAQVQRLDRRMMRDPESRLFRHCVRETSENGCSKALRAILLFGQISVPRCSRISYEFDTLVAHTDKRFGGWQHCDLGLTGGIVHRRVSIACHVHPNWLRLRPDPSTVFLRCFRLDCLRRRCCSSGCLSVEGGTFSFRARVFSSTAPFASAATLHHV